MAALSDEYLATPPPNVDQQQQNMARHDFGHSHPDERGSGQELPPEFKRKLEAWEKIKEKGGAAGN